MKNIIRCWQKYQKILTGIWLTTINRDNFLLSSCTCPCYLNTYICKHIIGVAAIEKLIKIPNNTKSVPIGKKPKRGRPGATKKALQYPNGPPTQPVSSVSEPTTGVVQPTISVVQQAPLVKRQRRTKRKEPEVEISENPEPVVSIRSSKRIDARK